MKTYRIPNTNLEVSRFAYGTMHMGGSWDDSPLTQDLKDRASQLLHAAVEHGITLIDLADIYTRGKSDEVVGAVLKQSPSLRDQIILQAKCGIILSDDPNPGNPGRYDFSYEHIIGSVENTLRMLNTDYVELLLLHRPDPLMEPEEVARAFDDLHSSGKVRYFGVSNHSPMQIELLKKAVEQPLVINQLEMSVLHNHMIDDGVMNNMPSATYAATHGILEYSRVNDMMIQAWSSVAGGKIFNPPIDAPQNIRDVAQEIANLAKKYETSTTAIALAWLLRHPAMIQPIIGTMKPERIAESVAADDIELTRIEWYRLFSAARGNAVP